MTFMCLMNQLENTNKNKMNNITSEEKELGERQQ